MDTTARSSICNRRVQDIMSPFAVVIRDDASVEQAARAMLDRRVSGLPVVDGAGLLVGIVTERDLLRRQELGTERHRPAWLQLLLGGGRIAEDYIKANSRSVADVMTTKVVSIGEDASLRELVDLLEHERIKRVPVVRAGRPVGVVSRADILRCLADAMQATHAAAPPSDREILRGVERAIARTDCLCGLAIDPTVVRGRVELHGVVTDERLRRAAIVAAESVDGVKSVVDCLIYVEPISGLVIEPPPASTGQSLG